MRIALLLAALLVPAGALAHGPGKLTGMWRAHQITQDGKARTYPEAFEDLDERAVWGRLLWVFEEESVTFATQVVLRNLDETVEKGSKTTREAEYLWCQAQATVPISWEDGHDPVFPSQITVLGSGGRTAGKSELASVCEVRLSLGSLVQVDNGPGAPKGATTLVNADESFVVVLVPDGRAAKLKDFLEGQNELE